MPSPPHPSAPPYREYRTIARQPPKPPAPPATAGAPRKRAATSKPVAALPATPGTPRKKAAVAGPAKLAKPGASKRPHAEPSRLDQLQHVIVASLEDDKAEAIVMLNLEGRAAFADRMIIATGLADRQITAMATHLEDKLSEAGLKRVQIEGATGSDWVLIDAGDIVIHLFKPESRTLYGLEKMWGADLDEGQQDGEQQAGASDPG
jgi:ribosome-associated protein